MQRNISKKSDQFSAAFEYPANGPARIIRRVVEPETPPLLFPFNSETVFLCKRGDFAVVLEGRGPHGPRFGPVREAARGIEVSIALDAIGDTYMLIELVLACAALADPVDSEHDRLVERRRVES